MKEGGYGRVFQTVTRNKNIPAAAKGLYGYLAAMSGISDECYPSIDTITKEMGMVKDTFYRHINLLVALGIVQKYQEVRENGRFGRTIYRLTHEVTISEKAVFTVPKNSESNFSESNFRESNNKETKSNNIKSNNIKKNNSKKEQTFNDLISEYSFSDNMIQKLREWMEYKSERRETYKPRGLKSLLSQIDKHVNIYGEQAIYDLIDESMANQWKGIIWDRMEKVKSKTPVNEYPNREGYSVSADNSNKTRGQAADYYRRYGKGCNSSFD